MTSGKLFKGVGSVLLCALCSAVLVHCDPNLPPASIYPDGPLIGSDGPEPMRGWDVDSLYGNFDRANYYNTGGDWYIVMENDALLENEFTQLFIIPDKDSTDVYDWVYMDDYRISERFLYIEDPMKAYAFWDYILFIYLDYKGLEEGS